MPDHSINIKIKLAFLWTTLMFLYIYADYFRLMTPGKLDKMISLQTPMGPTTPGLLMVFSTILIIPTLMIALSIFLKRSINRWINILAGFLYGIISILMVYSSIGDEWQVFFVIYNLVEIMVLFAIIWVAWKWPLKPASTKESNG